MKYLKVLIVVLILIVVGIAGYYVYLLSTGQKMPTDIARVVNIAPVTGVKPIATTGPLTETPRPFISTPKPDTNQDAYIVTDYRSVDLAQGDAYFSQGTFQSADAEDEIVNGVKYVFVVGILTGNGHLARIHLTQGEYENQMKDALTSGAIGIGAKVVVTLKPGLSDIIPDTSK